MQIPSALKHAKRMFKYRIELAKPVRSPSDLVYRHFKSWSSLEHVNYQLFQVLAEELGGRSAFIVETGTSAYGTDSTRFWNSYIMKFGGKVISIDIRARAGIQLKYQLSDRTSLITSDSVKYLTTNSFDNVDLYYFDSADVDWSAPEFALNHGLQELLAVVHNLQPGTIVVFDDTPISEDYVEAHLAGLITTFRKNNGFNPGKGSLAIHALNENFLIQVLHHEYAFACRILEKKVTP